VKYATSPAALDRVSAIQRVAVATPVTRPGWRPRTRSQQFDDVLILRVAKTKRTGYLPRHQAGRNAS
jgi:hypothetical protein